MKFKLTPELSYIIGLWKGRATKEGIGVVGGDEVIKTFALSVIDAGLTTHEKTQMREDRMFFYHSKYRLFFQDIIKNRLERFQYENKFSASYLAGRFDSCGGYNKDEKSIYITYSDKIDEMILLRLGFEAKLIGKKIVIKNKEKFLEYVKYFRKMKVGEEK